VEDGALARHLRRVSADDVSRPRQLLGILLLGPQLICRSVALGRVREVVRIRTDLLPSEEVVPVRIERVGQKTYQGVIGSSSAAYRSMIVNIRSRLSANSFFE